MSLSPTTSPFHCKYSVSALRSNDILYDHYTGCNVLGPPSSPQNLTAFNVTSNSVVLNWLNPITIGVPAFVRFTIELTATSQTNFMSTINVKNTDSLFINTFVTGLDPNTNYTITVRAVSTHPAVGELVSDSIMQAITTNASGMCV